MAEAQKDRTRLFDGKPEVITAESGKRLAEWLSAGEAPAPVVEPEPVDIKTAIRQHKLAKATVPGLLLKLNKANLDECDEGELTRIKNYLEAKEVEA